MEEMCRNLTKLGLSLNDESVKKQLSRVYAVMKGEEELQQLVQSQQNWTKI